jgi:tRNA pseudouridine38-40 synthase
MNIKFVFSYDGSRFNGSQMQPEKNTVADQFLNIFKCMGIDSQLVISGRTDKNVHAIRQVANIELPYYWSDLIKLEERLNKYLPKSIQIHNISIVEDNFHSRFSAKKRVYRYVLSTKKLSAFEQSYISYHDRINKDKIDMAIKEFIGIHDFEFYSKKGSEPIQTIREIFDVKFYKYKDYYIFKFKGSSFLRSQIRMMVQMLLNISDGTLSIDNLKNQLLKKEQKLKTLAPPNGLYLSKIIY